ncbi:MAG TPA: TldD/PmbA family protein [Trueperaceae bacterium]|nr:TldD/PmbA family protein [Trueperaceae bacterium]
MTYEQAKDYLLKRAKELNLELEVLATESRELELDSLHERLAKTSISSQGGIGVRVIIDGKAGYASTEEKNQEALEWVLSEAKENAELQTTSDAFLPQGENMGKADLVGEGLSAPIEEKIAAVVGLEHNLRQDSRLKSVAMTRYIESESSTTIASTKNLDGSYRNGYTGVYGVFVMQEGDSIKQSFDIDISKEFYSLDPTVTAQKMIKNAARSLGAKDLKTGKYKAYFEPRAFSQMLGLLQFMLNGKTVLEGKSLLADKLGQTVASSLVSIVDDPNLEKGLASHPFDSEGTKTKAITLIENGVLKSFLHNSATAKETGQANTGHASRSYKSSLGVSASNFYLKEGSGIKMDKGIIVTDLMGVHAGVNPISGDFSLQAFGILVEDGKEQHAVENFAISGNFIDLLQNISAIGDKLEWTLYAGIIGTPMVEVSELSFAGS